jgi:MOSC domain-containing protein YiiM
MFARGLSIALPARKDGCGETAMARLESVNVGHERRFDNSMGRTGIYKEPAAGRVFLGTLGVEGDCVVDTHVHGGPDQAAYVYFAEDYAWWSARLGRPLRPGMFGENLTISGLASADMAIGDRLTVGDVVLEVTAPRIPCNTLARRMEDPTFVKAFREAARPGVYCRVIAEGEVEAGMPVAHQPYGGVRVETVALFEDSFAKASLTPESLRRTLAAPVAERVRADWEALLARAEGA